MTVPIRSASGSLIAATRPQVLSRRVSLRVGSFGLTYSTDRLLWNPDVPPVDPAPAVETRQKGEQQPESSRFPQQLEAERIRALWASAQEQAAKSQALADKASTSQTSTSQTAASQLAAGPPAAAWAGAAQIDEHRPEARHSENVQAENVQADAVRADVLQDGQEGQATRAATRRSTRAFL